MEKIRTLWIKQNQVKEGIKERVRGALKNEKGQGMVEYGLILALVSVIAIVALSGIGTQLVVKFQEIFASLGGTPAP